MSQLEQKKQKISRQHQEIAEKCGKSLIKIGESLQKENQSDAEVGKSIAEHGKKILNLKEREAEQAKEAQNKSSSFDYYEMAAQQRRKATVEHTQAINEYNKLLQQKIETNRKQIENKNNKEN